MAASVGVWRASARVLRWLPESLALALARGVAITAGRRGAVRRALTANLRQALGAGDETPDAVVGRMADRAMASYAQYWVEGARLPSTPPSEVVDRFVVVEGRHHLEEARARGRGMILALPHMGSWEWGGAYLAQIDLPMTAVAEVLEPPEMFTWFAQEREAIGIHVVPLDDHAGTALLEHLRNHGVAGLLCDRDLQGNGVEVTFFGQRTTLPAGPATLALRTGATLLVAACYSGPGSGHYAVVVPPVAVEREGRLRDDVVRVTQAVAVEMEGLIRRAPEQWHVLQPRFTP
ncbi:MAG: phosphatidylinositol mannoside acyltransferase [Acidimicrobiales bacterium]